MLNAISRLMIEQVIFKLGTVDDMEVMSANKPSTNIYCKNKVDWCDGFAYTEQKQTA